MGELTISGGRDSDVENAIRTGRAFVSSIRGFESAMSGARKGRRRPCRHLPLPAFNPFIHTGTYDLLETRI